jgi:hypothetical protein
MRRRYRGEEKGYLEIQYNPTDQEGRRGSNLFNQCSAPLYAEARESQSHSATSERGDRSCNLVLRLSASEDFGLCGILVQLCGWTTYRDRTQKLSAERRRRCKHLRSAAETVCDG